MIRAARLVEHQWALDEPQQSAAGTWRERAALLLVVEDAAGNQGVGEAAPLPGFSSDSLEAARDTLGPLLGRELPARDAARPAAADLARASAGLGSPAARAALESALFDLWARQASVPAWRLLVGTAAPATLSAWLPDGLDRALAAAHRAQARGVLSFKVKLDAQRGLADGVETLEALRRTLGPGVRLRADANRSATPEALAPYLPRLAALGLEWLEEPTREPACTKLGVPLALDESLQTAGAMLDFAALPEVVALVLKPTALGGLARCLELGVQARQAGRHAVASHALEGPVSYQTAAALALALGSSPAHGLMPHPALRAARLPAFAPEASTLAPWDAPGLGLSVAEALAGATVTRELRA